MSVTKTSPEVSLEADASTSALSERRQAIDAWVPWSSTATTLRPAVVTIRPGRATTGLPKDGWPIGTDQATVG